MSSRRADTALVERGFYDSRTKARAAIEAGLVHVEGRPVAKPSAAIGDREEITQAGAAHPYVSRGGVKLAAGLDAFGFDPRARICLDIGASTGGFTQVLLGRGAARVTAVDVGRAQLHPLVAADPRVRALEATDARMLTGTQIGDPPSLVVVDVSFISLTLLLAPVLSLASPRASLLALVKPQFEAGRARVRKGIVKDPEIHRAVCETIAAHVRGLGWEVMGVIPSPIAGGDGNLEFLLGARRV